MSTSQRWHKTPPPPSVPAGLIVPFMDVVANIPVGWNQWNVGENIMLRGAAAAGAVVVPTGLDIITSETPSHNGGYYNAYLGINNVNTGTNRRSGGKGAHEHIGTWDYKPPTAHLILMKAAENFSKLPQGAGVLADSIPIAPLTDATPTGKDLGVAETVESLDVEESILVTDVAGSHHHVCCIDKREGSSDPTGFHWLTITSQHFAASGAITDGQQRYFMGLWKNASAEITLEGGMFAMWEGAAPPLGWILCDGTNGTPNLVDYFVGFDTAKLKTLEGDSTVSLDGVTDSNTHNHLGEVDPNARTVPSYHPENNVHDHTVTAGGAYVSKHRTVVFLKYIG